MNKLKPRTQHCFRRTTFSSNKVQYWATWNVSHCTSCKTILPLDIPDLFFFIFDIFVLCLITANYFLEMGFPASGSCGKKMLSCFFQKDPYHLGQCSPVETPTRTDIHSGCVENQLDNIGIAQYIPW